VVVGVRQLENTRLPLVLFSFSLATCVNIGSWSDVPGDQHLDNLTGFLDGFTQI
jgi:hypothetical protein